MSDTIKIEMNMPRPPEGWRYKSAKTGEAECRLPKKGEWYLDNWGNVNEADRDFKAGKYPILERVPWEPKAGERVWISNGYSFFNDEWNGNEVGFQPFKSIKDAQKYITESRALADRIRAESEVGS